MKVAEVMNPAVVPCRPDDSLNRAAQIMWEQDCGCAPVVEGGRLVGFVTDRDICMAAYTQGRPLGHLFVRAAMANKILSCRAEDSVESCLKTMAENCVRRLPVVDDGGRLVGILSLADVLQATLSGKSRKKLAEELLDTLICVTEPRDTTSIGIGAEEKDVLKPAATKSDEKKKAGKSRIKLGPS